MEAKLTLGAIISIFVVIIGLYVWFSRKSEKMVKKDFCDERSSNIEDCIEGVIKRSDERCAEHKRTTEHRHKELKQDMKDGFKEVKDLIKNNVR